MPARNRPVALYTAPGRIEIFVRNERFAVYRCSPNAPMGFSALYSIEERPVLQPDEDGLALRIARANVNGIDFDNQSETARPRGRIVLLQTTVRRSSHSVGFRQECVWLGPDSTPLLTDTRTFRFLPGPCEGGILDIALTLRTALGTSVTFGSAPHDLLLIRAGSHLLPEAGLLRNSRGDYGADQMHRRSADWCAAVGVSRGETVGIALLEHPQNSYFPTDWNCLPQGLLSPSPTLWSGMASELRGEQTFRYRLLVHTGYVEAGWAAARLQDFAHENIRGSI